jgi:hypothetical protein
VTRRPRAATEGISIESSISPACRQMGAPLVVQPDEEPVMGRRGTSTSRSERLTEGMAMGLDVGVTDVRVIPFLVSEMLLPPDDQALLGLEW